MPRTILTHLSIEVPDEDDRDADAIAAAFMAAYEVGMEGAPDDVKLDGLTVSVVLSEEV
jgi:hypothetical protein